MGLYDTVESDIICPKCNAKINSFQTKAIGSEMKYFRLGQPIITCLISFQNGSFEVHTICDSCNSWLEGWAHVQDGIYIGIKNLNQENTHET